MSLIWDGFSWIAWIVGPLPCDSCHIDQDLKHDGAPGGVGLQPQTLPPVRLAPQHAAGLVPPQLLGVVQQTAGLGVHLTVEGGQHGQHEPTLQRCLNVNPGV